MKLIVHDGDREKQVEVTRNSNGFTVTVDERTYQVDAASARASLRSLRIDGTHHEVAVRRLGDDPLSGKYWVSTPSGAAGSVRKNHSDTMNPSSESPRNSSRS